MRKSKKEVIDATEELVDRVCESEPQTALERNAEGIRDASTLMTLPYAELSEAEKEYLISALIVKQSEIEKLTNSLFQEIDRQKKSKAKALGLVEDTLTFIKTTVGNSLGSVSLAIKNLEREVKENGN